MIDSQLDAPLSFAQEQLWFIDRLGPRRSTYNVSYVTRLRGDLDVSALRGAIRLTVDRHDILRSRFFVSADGTPRLRTSPEARPDLVTADLSSSPAAARALVHEWAEEPFDLEKDTLARFGLVRVGDRDHLLGCFLHHAVCDGWSVEVLFQELAGFYASPASGPAPRPTAQYADYVRWQRERLSGPYLDRHLAWWRDYLSGVPTSLAMPEIAPDATGAELLSSLPRSTMDGVSALARAASTTPFTVLLAAYALVVARHTGMRRLLVGTQVAGRPRAEFLALIGLFVNTVPIRVDLDRAGTFGELVILVRESVLDALSHDQVPLGSIVHAVRPEREAGRMPLIQTAFAAQTSPPPRLALAGLEAEPVRLSATTSKYALSLSVSPGADGEEYEIALVHDARFVGAESARELVELYRRVVTAMVESPHGEIGALVPATDRAARPAAPVAPPREPVASPPPELAHLLDDVWHDVLKGRRFGIHDNFFDMGAQSLTLAVVHARLERELDRELPMTMFYEHPTIAALAAHLSGGDGGRRQAPRRRQSPAARRRRAARSDGG